MTPGPVPGTLLPFDEHGSFLSMNRKCRGHPRPSAMQTAKCRVEEDTPRPMYQDSNKPRPPQCHWPASFFSQSHA